MDYLTEVQPSDFEIIEAKRPKSENVLCRLRYVFLVADQKNGNNRVYPSAIVQREVDKFRESLLEARGLGMLDHPEKGDTRLDNASHTIDAVSYFPDIKKAVAESSLLKTTKGKDLWVLLCENVPLGASTRGTGTTTRRGDVEYINEDYNLISIDIVSRQSFGKETQITKANIFESYKTQADSTVTIYAWHEARRAGWQGDYEEFLQFLANKSLQERLNYKERILAGFKVIGEGAYGQINIRR